MHRSEEAVFFICNMWRICFFDTNELCFMLLLISLPKAIKSFLNSTCSLWEFIFSLCLKVPEMLRMPLTELCLQIKSLHLGDIKSFLLKVHFPLFFAITLSSDFIHILCNICNFYVTFAQEVEFLCIFL